MSNYQERVEESFRPLEKYLSSRALAMALAVTEGGNIVSKGFGQEKAIKSQLKDDLTSVTPTDHASQGRMVKLLREKIPGVVISAEEKKQGAKVDVISQSNIKKVIFVDPLDGTAPYIREIPVSAVTAADSEAGAVCIPGARFVWVGENNVGVWRMNLDYKNVPIQKSLKKVGVSDGKSDKPYGFLDMTIRDTTVDGLTTVIKGLPSIRKNFSVGCGCNVGNGTWVANGSAEFAVLLAKGGSWDFNGHRLTQFAGGFTCDQYGNPITPESEFGIATSTIELRDKLLELTYRGFNGYQGFAPKK